MMKKEQFDKLIKTMGNCKKCMLLKTKNGKDCSLINIFEQDEFAKNIPSIWTDWYNHLDASIMIIGQDWGPYKDMKKFYDKYREDATIQNWQKIINEEKSLTKKMLEKYLKESAETYSIEIDVNKLFITNAIMCARHGDNYRDNNIALNISTLNCKEYLKKQIEIVKPSIILTLGYYPLLAISSIYNFKIAKNLTQTIKETPKIIVDNMVVIPLFHPTAQISKDRQLQQYNRIWKHYQKKCS